jgi:hypothetical protein
MNEGMFELLLGYLIGALLSIIIAKVAFYIKDKVNEWGILEER